MSELAQSGKGEVASKTFSHACHPSRICSNDNDNDGNNDDDSNNKNVFFILFGKSMSLSTTSLTTDRKNVSLGFKKMPPSFSIF